MVINRLSAKDADEAVTPSPANFRYVFFFAMLIAQRTAY